jgi:phosphoribosylglycinamide formyltransferase-1|tara:strand:+ start:855 stop:1412 length:558 start_codon:yes stop_codon:yes gene_type:complete
MEAMIRHQQTNLDCGHQTVLVLSDRPDVMGLERAAHLGVESVCVPLPNITDRSERRLQHEQAIQKHLELAEVELVLLSGYMRLVTPFLIDNWPERILNIHPSLLPAFPGAHAHKDVLAGGVKVSGCTVHYVDEGMDTGAILAQRRVPVFPGDDTGLLAERVKVEEHILYPMVIDRLVSSPLEKVG